jgi:hypothetical protein
MYFYNSKEDESRMKEEGSDLGCFCLQQWGMVEEHVMICQQWPLLHISLTHSRYQSPGKKQNLSTEFIQTEQELKRNLTTQYF